jgi:hypothetical protein
MDANHAIKYLTRHFMSPDQAIHGMRFLQESIGVLKLYRRYFPDEFAAGNLRPVSEAGNLCMALRDFLELVHRHLFELPDYVFDEITEDDLPISEIPIQPMYDEWWDVEFEELSLLWQVLLILIGATKPDVIDQEAIEAVVNARQQWQGQVLDCDKLARLCRRQEAPLGGLCIAVLTIDHSTGNPWLDATYENPYEGVEWTVRNVNYLKKKWGEAQQAHDQIVSLNRWLCEDAAHIHELLALWSRALAPRPSGQNRPQESHESEQ